MRILALNGLLGYGYSTQCLADEFRRAVPDFIGVDAGSTDPGPHYLGSGKSFTNRQAVKRDLDFALPLAVGSKVPFIIGTAGGAGADVHVAWLREIIEEIARERKLSFRMAVVNTEIDKEYLRRKLRSGKIRPLDSQLPASEKDIDESVRIVGQIGVGPFIASLDGGAQVVLAGRACDTAIYAAPAIRAGFDQGLAFHMGKIMECGCLCAEPQSGSDIMTAVIEKDSFVLEPANPARRCTVARVAAHTMYEQSNPCRIYEPDGVIDLERSVYTQLSNRAVRVSNSRFAPAARKTIKVEGARLAGFRTITLAHVKDPLTIRAMDSIFGDARDYVAATVDASIRPDSYRMILRKTGSGTEAGAQVPSNGAMGIILDVVAQTQEIANTVCALARARMLHYDYPGRKTTAGNLALLYSPSDIPMGPVYTFSLYHLVEVDDLCETARINFVTVGEK